MPDPNQPTFKIEFSPTTTPLATPVWVDITAFFLDEGFSIRQGRQDETGPYQAGHATLTLLNTDRRFDPEYTSGAYYPNVRPMKAFRISLIWGGITYTRFRGFVESWQPDYDMSGRSVCRVRCLDAFGTFFARQTLGNERIVDAYTWPAPRLPDTQGIVVDSSAYAQVAIASIPPPYDRKVTISVTGSVTYAEAYVYGLDTGGTPRVENPTLATGVPVINPTFTTTYRYRTLSTLLVYSTFAPTFDTNIGAPVTIGYDNGLSAEYSGDAITTLLNAAGWPSGDRFIQSGISLIQAYTLTGAPLLSYLQTIADTEGGALFMNRSGVLTFFNRHQQLKRVTVATFGDDPTAVAAGAELPYSDVAFDQGERFIYNQVRRQRVGGAERVVRDNPSATAYLPRTYPSRGQTLQQTDAETLNQAQFYLGLFKDPRTRVAQLRFVNTRMPSTVWPVLLAGDLQTQYVVVRRPPGGGTITVTQVLESIAITMNAAHQIEVVWGFSPGLAGTPYKIFDDPTLGRFDYNAKAY